MLDDDLDPLIAQADLDGLVRLIDARCESRDWEGLLRVRTRSRFALESGRQLWPAATLSEYRLALYATADWATQVLDEDGGRFSIGPLTEVVAQNHVWSELSDRLPNGPRRSFVAYERALRGERIGEGAVEPALDIPIDLQPWEPSYPLPTYGDNGIDAPSPADSWTHIWSPITSSGDKPDIVSDPDLDMALRSLVEPWTSSSNGRAETLVIDGSPDDLLGALGVAAARITPLGTQQALAWLAWCGASGGAHGRRRGGALGRFGVWWTLAAIGGFTDEWDELCRRGQLGNECGDVAVSTSWFRFDDGTRSGYDLSLITHDADENISIALIARDHPVVA